MAPKIGYMHMPPIQYLYAKLKPNSSKTSVGNLWFNLLFRYIDVKDGFSQESSQYLWPGQESKRDIMIQSVRHIDYINQKRLIFIEDKREYPDSSTDPWERGICELTDYMKGCQAADSEARSNEPLFGVVTIGRHSRFYSLQPGHTQLEEYYNGHPLEFKENEERIDHILVEIFDRILQR